VGTLQRKYIQLGKSDKQWQMAKCFEGATRPPGADRINWASPQRAVTEDDLLMVSNISPHPAKHPPFLRSHAFSKHKVLTGTVIGMPFSKLVLENKKKMNPEEEEFECARAKQEVCQSVKEHGIAHGSETYTYYLSPAAVHVR
jgi:hypothetical protein